MNVPNLMAVAVLVIGIPLNTLVAMLLWRAYRDSPGNRVLRERFIAELFVLLLVIVFGLIFLNNDIQPPPLSFEATKTFTRLAMLAVAVIPASYWLYLYQKR